MKKLLLTAVLIALTSTVYAQISTEERAELKKYLSRKIQVEEAEVENELKKNAILDAYQAEIDEIVKRIRRQKVDEARNYQPTRGEIVDELKKRVEASKNCTQDGIDYCKEQTGCEGQGGYWYNGTCNAVPDSNIEQPE